MNDLRKEAEAQLAGLSDGDPMEDVKRAVADSIEYEVEDLELLPEELEDNALEPTPIHPRELVKQASKAYELLAHFNVDSSDMSPEEAVEKAKIVQEKYATFAQVLSRGQTNDAIERVLQKVPAGMVGQLVRNNELDIARYEGMGFIVLHDEETSREGTHQGADTRVIIGDLVVMVIDKLSYSVMEKVRAERKAARRAVSERSRAKAAIEQSGLKTF